MHQTSFSIGARLPRAFVRGALLAVLLMHVFGPPAAAQEAEVPLDADGRLFGITPDLEGRLNLFPEVRGFIEARLFEKPGGGFVLQILYRRNGRLYLIRRSMSLDAVAQFRREVTAALHVRAPSALLDQDGRGDLMRGALLLSLGYYGWAVPVALEVDDNQLAVALYMLVGSAGFYVPFAVTKRIPVTEGQASLSLYGATRGVARGMFGAMFLGAEDVETLVRAGAVVGLVEAVAGFVTAGRLAMTQGTADLTGTGGDLGAGIGLGLAYLAGLLDDTPGDMRNTGWGVGAGASYLGMLAGYRLAMTEPYTPGDNGVFRAASLIGGYMGLAAVRAVRGDDRDVGKAEAGGAVAGTMLGIVVGQRLVSGRDFRTVHGTFISLGALGGGLLGAGIGYLLSEDSDVAILVPSAAGAVGGFALLYQSFAQTARRVVERAGLEIRLYPVALALARGGRLPESARVPVASVTWRF